MKAWGMICLISFGGMIETLTRSHGADAPIWGTLLGVGLVGWSWAAVFAAVTQAVNALTGRRRPLPRTDPQALAAEMATLNAQIAQLRDTATSFDMSFDQTLQRLDERLRRVEQQAAYVPPTITVGRGQ